MMTGEFLPCENCGGAVRTLAVEGRRFYFETSLSVEVPADREAPTCTRCKQLFLNLDEAEVLEKELLPTLLARQARQLNRWVQALRDRHGAAQKQIAKVCGVTPSYLSHALAGKKRASVTFVRFLEALVVAPEEFKRHLEERPLRSADIRPFLVSVAASTSAPSWSSAPSALPRWNEAPPQEIEQAVPANGNECAA